MEYLLILFADLLTGIIFVLNKKYQQYEGAGLRAGLRSNYVIGFVQTLLFFAACGFAPKFSLYSFSLAAIIGALGATYTMIGLNVLKEGKVAVYAMFLMSGGMLLPFFYGVFFSHEPISPLRILGLLIILLAIVVTNFDKEKPSKKQILFSVLIFFLNGILVTISNIHQKTTIYPIVPTTSFIMMANAIKCCLCLIISLLLRFRATTQKAIVSTKTSGLFGKSLTPLLLLIATAVVDGAAFFCQVQGAANIPATVLYPLCSGGGIVMTALVGMLVLREKPNRAMHLGILLCIIGMCMFI